MDNSKIILKSQPNLKEIINEKWYYTIELLPGVFTNGFQFRNIILTRKILKNIKVKNMKCLDIGTMEGLVPSLLVKRGAQVVAYDRSNRQKYINLVKEAYNVEFEYINGFYLNDLLEVLKKKEKKAFDVVIFSGLLYHMFDPLEGLSIVRRLVRNGGILLIETAAIVTNTMSMYFNAGGRINDEKTTYFLPSLDLLDYMLRFFGLKALDVLYFKGRSRDKNDLKIVRVGIPCRAINNPLPEKNDKWMVSNIGTRLLDINKHIRSIEEGNKQDVSYKNSSKNLVIIEDTSSVNLYESVLNLPETTKDMELARLKLNDIY